MHDSENMACKFINRNQHMHKYWCYPKTPSWELGVVALEPHELPRIRQSLVVSAWRQHTPQAVVL